jgi:hypothetical protein
MQGVAKLSGGNNFKVVCKNMGRILLNEALIYLLCGAEYYLKS